MVCESRWSFADQLFSAFSWQIELEAFSEAAEVGVDGLINFDGLISMEFPIAVANYHLPPDFCHTSLLVSVTE